MSLDSDVIVDRRRIRRKLTFWRVAAVVVAIAAIVSVAVIATPGGRGALTASGSIARVNIEGLIRSASRRWSGWRNRKRRPSSCTSTRRAVPPPVPSSFTTRWCA
jgi:protease-4